MLSYKVGNARNSCIPILATMGSDPAPGCFLWTGLVDGPCWHEVFEYRLKVVLFGKAGMPKCMTLLFIFVERM